MLINFSVDVNGLTDLSFARIWSSPSHFGGRATFQTKDRVTSYLVVRDVGPKESGLYRYVLYCTVQVCLDCTGMLPVEILVKWKYFMLYAA